MSDLEAYVQTLELLLSLRLSQDPPERLAELEAAIRHDLPQARGPELEIRKRALRILSDAGAPAAVRAVL